MDSIGPRELRYDNRGVMVDGHRVTGPSLRAGRLSRTPSPKAWEVASRGRVEREMWWPRTIEQAVRLLVEVECGTVVFDDDGDMGLGSPSAYWLRLRPAPAGERYSTVHDSVVERSFWQVAQTHAGVLGRFGAETGKIFPSRRVVVERLWLTGGDLVTRLHAVSWGR